MPRLIDADALKDLEEMEYIYFAYPAAVPFYEAHNVWKVIDNAPTIAPASLRPTGEWILEHETYGKMICSLCKQEALYEEKPDPWQRGLLALFYVTSDYCPNCGAKMDLDGDA